MERQQLLKTSDRSVVINSSDKHSSSKLRTSYDHDQSGSLSQKANQSARLDRYEAKSSLMTVFSDIFSKKSSRNHSIMCDVLVTCFVVLNCFLMLTSCGVEATPVISEKQLSTYHLIPSGRNIRHLPCVSRRTKEEGVCMFAIDCLKANGTHLGTCIDRFYFGSCCQIPDYIDASINDNNIEDNTIFGKPIQEPVLKEGDLYVSSSPASTTSGKPSTTFKFPISSILESPATHYITKKPITAGSHTTTYIKFPTTNQNKITQTGVKTTKKPVALAANKTEEKVQPQIIPSLKPTRHNATLQDKYQTTTARTTYQSKAPTPTTSTIQTTIYINNQAYNASKPAATTRKPIATKPTTTEIPLKLSTYQSVQTASKTTTQKTTTFTFSSKRPSQRPESNLPFGTRLPSTTPGPSKPTTSHTVPIITSTRANLTTTQRLTTSKPKPERTTPVSTTTKATPTTKSTIRPTVQRPINSTLSNRRTTTTKPTTVFKRPTTVSSPSTQKPTTLIYKPFTSSLKPSSSQKPATLSQKPTTIYQKPLTAVSTTPKPNITKTKKPNITSTVPVKISTTKKPSTTVINRRPTVNITIISTTTYKPLTTTKTNVTTTSSITKYNYTSTTASKPSTTLKPTPSTRRPTVKPTQANRTPITTTKPKITTTPSPLTNEIDAPLSAKPTLEIKKTTTTTSTTTEKIGLVTWTNYVEPAVTVSAISNTTPKEQEWSSVSPTDGWILLSTVTPSTENVTIPNQTTVKLTTEAPKPTTTTTTTTTTIKSTIPSSTSSTTKLTTTSKPTNETKFENSTVTPTTEQEFTTFMLVSGGTVDYNISTVFEELAKINVTTVSPILDGNLTVANASSTTGTLTVDNDTLSTTESSVNGTTLPDDTQSTEKSTVSPIEIFTSTGIPTAESVNMTDYTDMCGRRLWPEARIVGGARSSFGRWPWQISLRQWRTSTYLHKCGAALLNENWAITAAHCVDSVPPSDLLLRLGEHDLANEEEPYGFQERRVQIVASHPQFDPRTFEYDLALLRFYEPVTFQPNILPVCVPTDDDGFIGKTAYVTGWGRLYEDGPLPSVLQEVSVPVIENAICESMYRSAGYIEHIPNIFICAGWRKGGFDSCEGDSGGPMVLQRADKRFLLAGVISWGIGCAEPNQPGVYTRISQFRHWINQILQF